ncbi:hypothetical protein ACP4OV_012663 [Aristida adscensionis]
MSNPADVQTPLERWGLEPSGSSMLLCLQLLCGCRVAGPCAKLQVPCMAAVHGATSCRAPSVEPMMLPASIDPDSVVIHWFQGYTTFVIAML